MPTRRVAKDDRSLFIDCDMGVDDFANALAFFRDPEMPPITAFAATYGCTNREQVCGNLKGFLTLTEMDVPIYRGCAAPLAAHPRGTDLPLYFGKNGFNDICLPGSDGQIESNTPDDLDQLAQALDSSPGPIDVLVTGPASTFVELVRRASQTIAAKVDRVFVMGGAIREAGNEGDPHPTTGEQAAEYNVYLDPFSFEELLRTCKPVHLVTWDQALSKNFALHRSHLQGFVGDSLASSALLDAFRRYYDLYRPASTGTGDDVSLEDQPLFLADPLVYLAYKDSDLERSGSLDAGQKPFGKFVDMQVKVVTESGPDFGRVQEASAGEGIPIRYYELTNPQEALNSLLLAFGLKNG